MVNGETEETLSELVQPILQELFQAIWVIYFPQMPIAQPWE